MTNDYNSIAGFYDVLSKLIFQKSIINAQKFLLQYIPANSNVLIVGGGTGWILEAVADLHQSNINITYIEKSARMIALSKKRNYNKNNVEFVNEAVEDFVSDKKFDVIFTAFLSRLLSTGHENLLKSLIFYLIILKLTKSKLFSASLTNF